jgi:hypothetical protein
MEARPQGAEVWRSASDSAESAPHAQKIRTVPHSAAPPGHAPPRGGEARYRSPSKVASGAPLTSERGSARPAAAPAAAPQTLARTRTHDCSGRAGPQAPGARRPASAHNRAREPECGSNGGNGRHARGHSADGPGLMRLLQKEDDVTMRSLRHA